jgi:hypothetical protein
VTHEDRANHMRCVMEAAMRLLNAGHPAAAGTQLWEGIVRDRADHAAIAERHLLDRPEPERIAHLAVMLAQGASGEAGGPSEGGGARVVAADPENPPAASCGPARAMSLSEPR